MSVLETHLTTVIEPRSGVSEARPSRLWRYRELWWTMAMRDLSVRYKQTALGAAWAVIVPVVSMLVMHVFFGKVVGLADRVGDVAYPIFLYAGNLPWVLFSSTVNASSNSLVNNAHILGKVYFPRLVLPLSAAVAPLVDYFIAFGVLLGMMWWFDVAITWRLTLLVPLLAVLMLASVGLSVLLSAVMVRYRDVRHAIPFLIQLLFFATPVVYPLTFVPERYQWVIYLNPVAGVIESMRAVTLSESIAWAGVAISAGVSIALAAIGAAWFAATERKFADVI